MTEELIAGVLAAADVVGDRWSLPVLAALSDGPQRFSDLRTRLDGVAPNVLSRRLSDLERAGLVMGRPYQRRPPRLAYELTERGAELVPALQTLAAWSGVGPELVHATCGSGLAVRWWCPTCEASLEDPDDGLVHV